MPCATADGACVAKGCVVFQHNPHELTRPIAPLSTPQFRRLHEQASPVDFPCVPSTLSARALLLAVPRVKKNHCEASLASINNSLYKDNVRLHQQLGMWEAKSNGDGAL